jgi:hypothetical protein
MHASSHEISLAGYLVGRCCYWIIKSLSSMGLSTDELAPENQAQKGGIPREVSPTIG